MWTVGINDVSGGGSPGCGPTPAETGSLACSPQADRPSAAIPSTREQLRAFIAKSVYEISLGTGFDQLGSAPDRAQPRLQCTLPLCFVSTPSAATRIPCACSYRTGRPSPNLAC